MPDPGCMTDLSRANTSPAARALVLAAGNPPTKASGAARKGLQFSDEPGLVPTCSAPRAAQRARAFLGLWRGANAPTCSYLTRISSGPGNVTFTVRVAVRGADSSPVRRGHALHVRRERAEYLAAQLKHRLLGQAAEKLAEITLRSDLKATKTKAWGCPALGW